MEFPLFQHKCLSLTGLGTTGVMILVVLVLCTTPCPGSHWGWRSGDSYWDGVAHQRSSHGGGDWGMDAEGREDVEATISEPNPVVQPDLSIEYRQCCLGFVRLEIPPSWILFRDLFALKFPQAEYCLGICSPWNSPKLHFFLLFFFLKLNVHKY